MSSIKLSPLTKLIISLVSILLIIVFWGGGLDKMLDIKSNIVHIWTGLVLTISLLWLLLEISNE